MLVLRVLGERHDNIPWDGNCTWGLGPFFVEVRMPITSFRLARTWLPIFYSTGSPVTHQRETPEARALMSSIYVAAS